MNADHLELCASEGWKEVLRDLIVPYALAERVEIRCNPFGWAAHASAPAR